MILYVAWFVLALTYGVLFFRKQLWRTRRSAKVGPRDGTVFISNVPHGKEREWLAWHWKLATTQFGNDYVFREMPLPPRHDDMEQPRKVDPVPTSWYVPGTIPDRAFAYRKTYSAEAAYWMARRKSRLDEIEYNAIRLELPR